MLNIKEKLGLRIRELRNAKGIKQCELADMLNMERSHLTRIESGKHSPSDENLYKIANILNVEIKDLFDFEHNKPEEDLISEIIDRLNNHPDRIKDFYKIVIALTK